MEKIYKSLTDDGPSFMQTILQDHMKKFNQGIDDLIKSKFIEKGYDPEDIEFLKTQCEVVTYENDPDNYKHYFVNDPVLGKVRIISISGLLPNSHEMNVNDALDCKMTLTINHY